MARKQVTPRKDSLSTPAGRLNRIHGLTVAALQILHEQEQEEIANFDEVMAFFKNPPYSESDGVILDPKQIQPKQQELFNKIKPEGPKKVR